MAQEYKPGMFAEMGFKLGAEADRRTRIALEPLANLVERQAKINASNGAHKLGTPTPARRGEGPAVISGNLRRSITHSPITKVSDAWETKVGTAIGFPSPYGKNTPASQYGLTLETILNFPFLLPAFKFAVGVPAQGLYEEAYGAGWNITLGT